MCDHGSGGSSQNIPTVDCSIALEKLQQEITSKFQPKKGATVLLSDVYQALGLDGRALRVADCGSFLEFHVAGTEKKLHRANFCKDRLCPMCNWRRSLKIFRQVSQIMDSLEREKYRFLFLTLTVKNCPADTLPDTVQMLFDGWRYLSHKNKVFRSTVCGSFRSLEVTRNHETGEFHPHFHVILAVRSDYFYGRNYMTQVQWSELWRSACDLAYDPIVHVQTVKGELREDGSADLGKAVAEVAKYAVKSSDYLAREPDERLESVAAFLSALSGRKLVSLTGCFREAGRLLVLDDMEDGDLVHVDDDTLREDVAYMVVRYGWRNGVYVRL